MAKIRMMHASTHGARKPSGPKKERKRPNDGNNNGQAMYGACKHAWRTQAAWAKIKTLTVRLQSWQVASNSMMKNVINSKEKLFC